LIDRVIVVFVICCFSFGLQPASVYNPRLPGFQISRSSSLAQLGPQKEKKKPILSNHPTTDYPHRRQLQKSLEQAAPIISAPICDRPPVQQQQI
jgi:hypothetical protein